MNRFFLNIIKLPKKAISFVTRMFSDFLCAFYKLPSTSTAVIVMDGGLCSQMFDYALGEMFHQKGYEVLFDLTWFKKYGKDVLGNHARVFEINKLYPDLIINKASSLCIHKWRNDFTNQERDFEKVLHNNTHVYFENNIPITVPPQLMSEVYNKLYKNPQPVCDKENLDFAKNIASDKNSCAVHVRRGDLAVAEIASKSGYGNVVSDNYYINAILYMKNIYSDIKFYFFSDDLAYVKTSLLPLFENINYQIVDVNSITVVNGGGYKDFYLITRCKNVICSLGSFGIQAAKIIDNPDKVVISPRDNVYGLTNYIVLDEKGNFVKCSDSLRSRIEK